MFRLYGNIAGWRALDEKEKEKDIIETMIDYSNDTGSYDYLITKVRGERNTNYKESPYKRIIGKKQLLIQKRNKKKLKSKKIILKMTKKRILKKQRKY